MPRKYRSPDSVMTTVYYYDNETNTDYVVNISGSLSAPDPETGYQGGDIDFGIFEIDGNDYVDLDDFFIVTREVILFFSDVEFNGVRILDSYKISQVRKELGKWTDNKDVYDLKYIKFENDQVKKQDFYFRHLLII